MKRCVCWAMRDRAGMKAELKSVCTELIRPYRAWSYAELRDVVISGGEEIRRGRLKGGAEYQAEINVHWDDKPEGGIRVSCFADIMPSRLLFGFLPISVSTVGDDFLMWPDGVIR